MSLNLVMMATGEFALPSLRALVDSSHRIAALITQPDRVNPRGKPHPHPLKEFALSRNLPVLQPDSINTDEALIKLQALRPDVVLVAAYGQILKDPVIRVPRLGTYNLHASLLPRHRGAAPVQYSVWKGDETTGVTIFQIEPKLDAGPILLQHETPILPDETSGQLHDRLALLGATAFLDFLDQLESGTATRIPQDPDRVTLAPKIRKEQGSIDWNQTPREIDCHIRAMQPWPNAFTFLHQSGKPPERLLILRVAPGSDSHSAQLLPGDLLPDSADALSVVCGKGTVQLLEVQRAGKKPMHIEDFLRGTTISPRDHLGPE